jgi:hypothetical protein
MGRRPRGIEELRLLEDKRKELLTVCADHGYDAGVLAKVPGAFYAEPVDFNAIRAADLLALAGLAEELRETAEREELQARAGCPRGRERKNDRWEDERPQAST